MRIPPNNSEIWPISSSHSGIYGIGEELMFFTTAMVGLNIDTKPTIFDMYSI